MAVHGPLLGQHSALLDESIDIQDVLDAQQKLAGSLGSTAEHDTGSDVGHEACLRSSTLSACLDVRIEAAVALADRYSRSARVPDFRVGAMLYEVLMERVENTCIRIVVEMLPRGIFQAL